MRPAVFLDRDGTVIEHVHHLCDPAGVRLIPRAAEAIGAMQEMGYACVIVTNQSAIGRGLLTIEGLEAIHAVMRAQLREKGVKLDGVYYCPVAPGCEDRRVIEHADRKPGPGMLLRAAKEMGLDVSSSWMIGDMLSDLLAGRNAGCCGTILVRTGMGKSVEANDAAIDHVAADLIEACGIIGRHREAEGPEGGRAKNVKTAWMGMK
jgi:D-glycero-D-manno-heptose 1,7-bisphosphate phosphatase